MCNCKHVLTCWKLHRPSFKEESSKKIDNCPQLLSLTHPTCFVATLYELRTPYKSLYGPYTHLNHYAIKLLTHSWAFSMQLDC